MEEARIFISLIFQTVVVICNISKGMGFLYFSLKNLLRKWHIHKHMFWEAFIFISNAGELTLLDGGLFFMSTSGLDPDPGLNILNVSWH